MGRWDGVAAGPYPDDHGVKARLLDGPVLPPERRLPASDPRPRRSGDPHCPACQPGRACPDHADYRTDPLAGVA